MVWGMPLAAALLAWVPHIQQGHQAGSQGLLLLLPLHKVQGWHLLWWGRCRSCWWLRGGWAKR